MIQLLRHQEIDKTKWETCLQRACNPLVYAHAWYLNAVCGSNWDALAETKEGRYVSIFPVPYRRFLGQAKVVQPLFTQQLGLFCTPESEHREVPDYLALLPQHYQQVVYQLPSPEEELLLPQNWQMRERPNYELSLQPPYEVLRQGYATNLKRNLKKAQSAQLSATADGDFETLLRLFKATKGQELDNLKARHYNTLRTLYQNATAAGVSQLWQVAHHGNPLCTAFLLNDGPRITYLFGASSAQGRSLNAMAFLMDQIIQQEAGRGKALDFEGSEIAGVAKFYANFGAQPVRYLSLSFQNQSTARPWIRNVFTSLAKRLR